MRLILHQYEHDIFHPWNFFANAGFHAVTSVLLLLQLRGQETHTEPRLHDLQHYYVKLYSRPSLLRPPYMPRKCGHIREVGFAEGVN